VLLAEDNPVNRELAVALLTGMGHRVEVASNGRAVLAALEKAAYDVILMDLQMPGLDGLETTREIRRREEAGALFTSQAGSRIPIIALTAHAVKGDRDACLTAGMDDYIAKPVRRRELVAMVSRLVTPTGVSGPRSPSVSEPPPASAKAFDPDRLLDGLGGNRELVRRLAAVYFETTPPLLEKIRAAIASGRPAEAATPVHTLKGSLSQFGADPARTCAAALEATTRKSGPDASLLAGELHRELERFDSALRQFLEDLPVETAGERKT